MKLKILGLIITVLLFTTGPALAQEKGIDVSGGLTLGLRSVHETDGSAKFQEYRDLRDGVFGDVDLNVYRGKYYLDFTGENIGLDDQFYQLRGGKYESFKYSLYYNEIPHNLSFGARTFYAGSTIGTGTLDYFATDRARNTDTSFTPNITTNPALWNTFDYAIKRKDVGGALTFSFGTPFFLTVEANTLETKGVKPWGAPSGVFVDRRGVQGSAFGNVVEMPAPVDYKTNTLGLKTGYNTQPFMVALEGMYSKFENSHDYLRWRNPYVTTAAEYEVSSLAADNDYWNVSAQGRVRLPLSSALAAKVGYSKLTNSLSLLNTIPSATSGTATTSPSYFVKTLGLSHSTFDGDIRYTTAGVALTSSPIRPLDVKLFYNYLKKDNESPIIEYTDPVNGATVDSELFKYDKNNVGLDLGYRLPLKTKALLGYEYLVIKRERPDAEKTKDNLVYVGLKNSYFDMITGKIRYERLWRSSDFANASAGTGPTDPDYFKRFVRRYDATDKTMDAVKIGVDISPLEHLEVGLEFAYKQNDYKETVLGRTKDRRYEYYVDAAYEMPELFRLKAFFDYEDVKYDSKHRNVTPTAPFSIDPNAAPTANSYNWNATVKDASYA
ncbi:MAG: MtrB/PioB family outer membrane beta-barrel protein, partial [Deltaproteobacteria bacterium]|nr:MtrB/PioB family outer membrane beta-barrel protein [Deltaproteobacteria bacterium]